MQQMNSVLHSLVVFNLVEIVVRVVHGIRPIIMIIIIVMEKKNLFCTRVQQTNKRIVAMNLIIETWKYRGYSHLLLLLPLLYYCHCLLPAEQQ